MNEMKPSLCPVCRGSGQVQAGLYDPPAEGSTAVYMTCLVSCRSCMGRGFIVLDNDQSWFWKPEWQDGEREADKDIREGNVTDAIPGKDEKHEFNHIALGLYRVFWKDDEGCSVAAVGYNSAGRRWLAPTNWISVPTFDWSNVDRVELITTQAEENEDSC